ncbi:hypothetical protein [Polaribacter sp. MED152]|uniref:hypothetical protein n=1 Tax=Polaribacter sp. MED152 TaxID=313598 RepID=UPI000068C66D|nr:hypothetical protein [Polaribacter sp. MED152]EAQ43034.1 hypothetical protein MED152_09930 [Polaribacter sp. MED152]
MYLTTLNGVNKIVQNSAYYKGIRQESYKRRLIDKCNFVVNAILQGNQYKYQSQKTNSIPLHNDILLNQLGKNYQKVLSILLDANLIETNNSYKVNEHSKKYRLTNEALKMDIIKGGVLHHTTIRKFNSYRKDTLKSLLKDKDIAKIFYSVTDTYFNAPKDMDAYLDSIIGTDRDERRLHYEDWFKQLVQFNSFTTTKEYLESQFYIMKCKKTSRIYNTYTHIPKEFRKLLTTKSNDKLIELDLKNSQPFILSIMFYLSSKDVSSNRMTSSAYSNKLIEANRNKINNTLYNGSHFSNLTFDMLTDIITGDFYLKFIKTKNKLGFQNDIPTNDRKEIKPYALKSFYAYCSEDLSKEEQVLKYMYPMFFKWLKKAKNELNKLSNIKENAGHKLFAQIVQNIESNIFVKQFFSKLPMGMFAFPIHDSITCKETDKEYIKALIIDSIQTILSDAQLDRNIVKDLIK